MGGELHRHCRGQGNVGQGHALGPPGKSVDLQRKGNWHTTQAKVASHNLRGHKSGRPHLTSSSTTANTTFSHQLPFLRLQPLPTNCPSFGLCRRGGYGPSAATRSSWSRSAPATPSKRPSTLLGGGLSSQSRPAKVRAHCGEKSKTKTRGWSELFRSARVAVRTVACACTTNSSILMPCSFHWCYTA